MTTESPNDQPKGQEQALDGVAIPTPHIASETMAGDLLQVLIDQIRLLSPEYASMTQAEQATVIDRSAKVVRAAVSRAVSIMQSDNRVSLLGELTAVRVKDGSFQALISSIDPKSTGRLDLVDSVGHGVTIVLATNRGYQGGVEAVKPDPDQRALDLSAGAKKGAEDALKKAADKAKGKPKKDGDGGPASSPL